MSNDIDGPVGFEPTSSPCSAISIDGDAIPLRPRSHDDVRQHADVILDRLQRHHAMRRLVARCTIDLCARWIADGTPE